MPTEYPFDVPAEVSASLKETILPEQFPPPNDFDSFDGKEEPVFLDALLNWKHEMSCGFTTFKELIERRYGVTTGSPYEQRCAHAGFHYLSVMLEQSIERGETLIKWIRASWPYDPVIKKHFKDPGRLDLAQRGQDKHRRVNRDPTVELHLAKTNPTRT